MSPELEHFVRLARAGAHGAASGGEQRARELAIEITKAAPGLDDQALEGAKEFLDAAKASMHNARAAIHYD